MKALAIVLLLFAGHVQAETFIGITTATNRLVVGTNEVIIISKFQTDDNARFQLVKDGNTYTSAGGSIASPPISQTSPSAVAGPCELIFTNQTLLSYQRLLTTSIQTVILTPSPNTNSATVSVAFGQSLRVFKPLPVEGSSPALATRGTNAVILKSIAFTANDEFAGPIDLTFFSATYGSDSHIFSYVITEDSQAVPQGVAVQSGTGAFHLELENPSTLPIGVPPSFRA